MAETTIVNTPAQSTDSGAGWAVALIVIIAVLVGGFVWYRYYGPAATPASSDTTNINVTLPTPTAGGTNPATTPK